MLARYREAVETVLRFRDNRDRQIRRAVIGLLPRLAAFAPERFAATYLRQCTEYLLLVLKIPSERGAGKNIDLGGGQPVAAALLLCRRAAWGHVHASLLQDKFSIYALNRIFQSSLVKGKHGSLAVHVGAQLSVYGNAVA